MHGGGFVGGQVQTNPTTSSNPPELRVVLFATFKVTLYADVGLTSFVVAPFAESGKKIWHGVNMQSSWTALVDVRLLIMHIDIYL